MLWVLLASKITPATADEAGPVCPSAEPVAEAVPRARVCCVVCVWRCAWEIASPHSTENGDD